MKDVPARRDVDYEENVPDGCKMCLGDVDCAEDVPEVWDDVGCRSTTYVASLWD